MLNDHEGGGVAFQAGKEVPAVAVDAREQLVAEVAEIEEQQPIAHLRADLEHRTVVRALRCDLHGVVTAATHPQDDVSF